MSEAAPTPDGPAVADKSVDVEVDAPITHVRVFHQGAEITRAGELPSVSAGEAVVVRGLPLGLDNATLAVEVDGSDDVIAQLVQVGVHALDVDDLDTFADEERLRELTQREKRLRRRVQRLAAEETALQGIPAAARAVPKKGSAPPPSPMSSRFLIEDYKNDQVGQRVQERRQVQQELKEVLDEKARLEEQKSRASSQATAQAGDLRKQVRVELSGPVTSTAEVRLRYRVAGARWVPTYQCRLKRTGDDAQLVLRAQVQQATGEDWRRAKLELSTASPQTWHDLPVLEPIRIGKKQPPKRKRRRPPPQGAADLFGDALRDWTTSTAGAPQAGQLPSLHLPLMPLMPVRAVAPAYVVDDGAKGGGGYVTMAAPSAGAAYDDDSAEGLDALEMEEDAEMLFDEAPMVRMAAPMAASAPPPGAPPPAPMAKKAKARARRGPSRDEITGVGAAVLDDEYGAMLEAPASPTYADLVLADPYGGERGLLQPQTRLHLVDGKRRLPRGAAFADALTLASVASQRAMRGGLPTGTHDVKASARHFDFVYQADDVVTVASDGAFHSVPLSVRTAPCELQYVVVPREDAQVFRLAKLTNPLAAPLLPGPVEVYVDDDYVLTTQLDAVSPKGKFDLGLGVEQAIKCTRNTRFDERRSGEKVVAMNELHHSIAIELENHLPKAVHIDVLERIPQPHEGAEVVVEEVDVVPAWVPYDQREVGHALHGGRKWTLSLDTGAKDTMRAEYVVKIYANNELVGGNRREDG